MASELNSGLPLSVTLKPTRIMLGITAEEVKALNGLLGADVLLRNYSLTHQPVGLRRGEFTCVKWQVTPYDPIWQVISHSSKMEFH